MRLYYTVDYSKPFYCFYCFSVKRFKDVDEARRLDRNTGLTDLKMMFSVTSWVISSEYVT